MKANAVLHATRRTGLRPHSITQAHTPEQERLARSIDLSLVAPRLKIYNFFAYSSHAGRLRFCLGHNDELQVLPAWFRHTRLTLDYSAESVRDGITQYRQTVELSGACFRQSIEAQGFSRPHSKQSSYSWRWVCPKCNEFADLLLAKIGRDFSCLDCHPRPGDYLLNATFQVLPREVQR